MAYYVPAPTAWGGRGNLIDDQGNLVKGTSSVDTDLDYYRAQEASQHQGGPQIDQSRSNETRNVGMGALGLLEQRAQGGLTPAQRLAGQQTQGAINSVYSGAASVKGGAMARAAAGRMAVAQGARIRATGNQDTTALAARERAEAAGQYNAAATAQRGTDLGVATEQAKLNAGQRAADDGRESFFQGLGYSTQKARTDAQLGRSAADEAASNAGRQQSLAEQQQSRQQTQQVTNTIVGGVQGGLQGYAQGQTGANTAPPPPRPGLSTRDDPYGTSDERAKEDIEPLGYMTSDAASKSEAYALGRAHQWEQAKTGKPVEWAHEQPKDITDRGEMSGDRGKVAQGGGKAAVKKYGRVVPPESTEERASMAARVHGKPAPKAEEPMAYRALGAVADAIPQPVHDAFAKGVEAMPDPMPAAEQPMAPAGAPPAQGGWQQFAARARAMTSDERAKGDEAAADDMAHANRSMAPFSYAYKSKWAKEAGQKPGERNVGPMAQNMAANPVASTAIFERPDGMLAIDKDKALKLTMGGLADLQGQVDDMKKKRTA